MAYGKVNVGGGVKAAVEIETNPDRLYHGDITTGNLYELNISSLSLIKTVSAPMSSPTGIGGIIERLWYTDSQENVVELNPDTLVNISSNGGYANNDLTGIGGMNERLYLCGKSPYELYEINTTNSAIINTAPSPSGAGPSGIGGISNRVYHVDSVTDKVYELNPDTLVQIKTVTSPPGGGVSGIGGVSNQLYSCDFYADKYYELNYDTLVQIKSVASAGSHPHGIGGVKTITRTVLNIQSKIKVDNPDLIKYLETEYTK